MQPGIERAGANRSLSSLDLRDGRSATDRGPRGRRGGDRAHRGFERRAWLHAELAPEQIAARGGLACRADAVARSGEAAHEQRLEVLVQGVLAHEPTGQIGRFGCGTSGQAGQRSLAQDRLSGRLKVSALSCEPNVE